MATITAFFSQPWFWLALVGSLFGLALLAWWLRMAWWPAWLLRVLLVTLTLLALFGVLWRFEPARTTQRQVMVLDQSDSLSAETRRQALEQALLWQAEAQPVEDGQATRYHNRSIVIFAHQAEPLLSRAGTEPDAPPALDSADDPVDGRASNLLEALLLAENLLGGAPGQILLASDGLAAQPVEVSARVASLAEQGHTLDVIPLAPRPMENDLALGELAAPRNLWAGTAFDLLVPLRTAGGTAPGLQPSLALRINGQLSALPAEPAADLPDGIYRFRVPSLPEGMATLEVEAAASGPGWEDPFPENNRAFTVLQVFPPPRGLLVTARADSAALINFHQALAQQQVQLEIVTPANLPTNLEALQNYQVIFLDNLLSTQINREQQTALRLFAARLAGGVVFLGGRSSYTLGGYEDTPLEAMLPVKLEPPPRTQRPPMVFQLILDRSASMRVGERGRATRPIDLAREAAIRSVESLQPEDYLGVLTFSDEPNWDFPLGLLGSNEGLEQAIDAISRVTAEGTTYMYEAMQETIGQMQQLPADAPQARHILLLSDGESTDGKPEDFQALAEAAQAQGITISTIALGRAADQAVMEQIAVAGKGRFYSVANAEHLPRILLAESRAARSENIQQGETSLRPAEPGHPVLAGAGPGDLPLLRGYNALQSRAEEGAEDILVSTSFGDPVLSAWQFGLGRVAAWTGDLGEEWTTGWPAESAGPFWARTVRYLLVNPAQGPAQASVLVEPTRLRVEAAIYTPEGRPVNLAEVRFTFMSGTAGGSATGGSGDLPPGQAVTYRLAQVGPGQYQADIPRPPEGAYRAVLAYSGGDGPAARTTQEVPAPFAVNPPEEWLPQDALAGQTNLAAWSGAAGGSAVTLEDLLAADRALSEQRPGLFEDVWERLLLALVILWPLEIAIRRRWLPWME